MDTPAIKTRFNAIGVVGIAPERRGPEYLAKYVVEAIARWEGPIKAAGLEVDGCWVLCVSAHAGCPVEVKNGLRGPKVGVPPDARKRTQLGDRAMSEQCQHAASR